MLNQGLLPGLKQLVGNEIYSLPLFQQESVPIESLNWLSQFRNAISQGMAALYAASTWAREVNKDEICAMSQVFRIGEP